MYIVCINIHIDIHRLAHIMSCHVISIIVPPHHIVRVSYTSNLRMHQYRYNYDHRHRHQHIMNISGRIHNKNKNKSWYVMVSVAIQKACLEVRHLSTSDFLLPRHLIISICLRRFTTRRVNDVPHAFRCIQTGGE